MTTAVTSEIEEFRVAMSATGLTPPAQIIPDGKIHRFSTTGRSGDKAGWCVFYGDHPAAGAFGDWRSGVSETWSASSSNTLTPEDRQAHQQRLDLLRQQREEEEARGHEEAAAWAAEIWENSQPAPADHPYLLRKLAHVNHLRVYRGDLSIGGSCMDGALVLSLHDAGGKLCSLEFICADGTKRFLPGGRKRGCYSLLGEITDTVCLVEGYATGSSVHQATGYPVVIAFDAGNLKPVAEEIHSKHPSTQIIVCGDNDVSETGQKKAREAAQAVGGMVVIPDAPGSDWNDVHQRYGLEAVRTAVMSWPEPLPLIATIAAEPYPIDALPDWILQAVEEVRAFTQAPVPLVAASALATVSLAGQAHIDVKRADRLTGPTSLFLLSLADSGERKSTTDSMFSNPIREYDLAQAEKAKPDLKRYAAEYAGWEAEREGILTAIKQAAKSGERTDDLKGNLAELELKKPVAPRVPQLLHGDDTPEHLAYTLAHKYPSAGILTAEAGLVFGSHGMGTDSVMRNLALFNTVWDGGTHQIGRRTSESYTVRGARVTMGLQVQAPTLRNFVERSGGLARGTGFFARFLLAWPESTQGYRPFKDPPETWPALDVFHRRISEILGAEGKIDGEGALAPTLMPLSPEAKAIWVSFHDGIEEELRTGGELYDVRDVASKIADNAARLAALFQLFCSNCSGCSSSNVSAEHMEAACRIAAWHLNESRRFFGELAMPTELADAAQLDAWLIRYCLQGKESPIPIRIIQQCGPNKLRNKTALLAAVGELEKLHRIRLVGKKAIAVNPALLTRKEDA